MSEALPIPRDTRERTIAAGAGQTAFGPFDFAIYDLADVAVAIAADGGGFTPVDDGFTVLATGALPSTFTVVFDTAPGEGALVRVRGRRVPSRTMDVTRGGIIRSQALERDLDVTTIEMQELRRDIDDAKGPKGDAGAAATIAVGTVATGAPGSAAAVINSGTASAATFDFVIPRGAAGSNGLDGSDPGFRYFFDAATAMADPGAGKLRLDSATHGAVATIALSAQTAESGNPNVHASLQRWDASTTALNRGAVLIRKLGAPQNFIEGIVDGARTDNTSWLAFPFTVTASAGAIGANDAVTVQFARSGDQGASGAGTGDVTGPATNSADYVPQWNGANSKTLKNGLPVSALGAALLNAVSKTAHGLLLGAGTGEPGATAAGTDGQVPVGQTGADPVFRTISGDVTVTAAGAATIANAAVTYAKIQAVSATQRLLGRNTAGAGAAEEVSLTQALDWLGATRGAVLYRGASGWTVRAPGTSGYILTSAGAGADPDWLPPSGGGGGVTPSTNDYRLTIATGVPYLYAATTGATSVYLTPAQGRKISLYDGSSWQDCQPGEIGIPLTASQTGTTTSGSAVITGLTDTSQLVAGMKVTGSNVAAGAAITSIDSGTQVTLSGNSTGNGSNTMTFKCPADTGYDVFAAYVNATTAKLFLKPRAAIPTPNTMARQDGVEVLSGSPTRRWVGAIATSGTDGQIDLAHTGRRRYRIWNRDNRVYFLGLETFDSSGTWYKPMGLLFAIIRAVGGGWSTNTTSSFGSHVSATGASASNIPGLGSGGDINLYGGGYINSMNATGGTGIRRRVAVDLGATETVTVGGASGCGAVIVEESLEY